VALAATRSGCRLLFGLRFGVLVKVGSKLELNVPVASLSFGVDVKSPPPIRYAELFRSGWVRSECVRCEKGGL